MKSYIVSPVEMVNATFVFSIVGITLFERVLTKQPLLQSELYDECDLFAHDTSGKLDRMIRAIERDLEMGFVLTEINEVIAIH